MAYHHQQPPPLVPQGQQSSSFANLALSAVLEDLCARFIVNLPAEELESMDRVCFQIEQAHWYYEDFVRPTAANPSLLPSYSLKAFSLLIFKSCPLLHDLLPSHGKIWTSFMAYKERVPVCGAVMINEWWDKVLLVKGWSKGSSWSFPRGKINKQEPEAMCAVREVLEETGYDLSDAFPPHQLHPSYQGEEEGVERVPYYIELVIREQKIRLYFVPGVPENTRFETRTRKEISKIDWFPLSSLPTWSKISGGKNSSTRTKGELANGKQAKFYMVTPFISHLKLWIDRNKPKNLPPRSSPSAMTIPLSPEVDSPRPINPTPHYAFFGGHPLVPWSDDSTSHLPSETEQEASESSVATSTEDEDGDDEYVTQRQQGPAGMQTWETRQEGTDALQALFFGSPTAQPTLSPLPPPPPLPAISSSASASSRSQHATPPARPLPVAIQQQQHSSSSSSLTQQLSAATPPQVAYERQQSFLQPRAQQSKNQQGQQARLLELLTGQGFSTPPPPAAAVAPGGPQQDGTGSLLGLLNNMHLPSSAPQISLPPASSQTHASILFGGAPVSPSSTSQYPHTSSTSTSHQLHNAFSASPPPEALLPSVAPESARTEEEKREKHNALLRALFTVAAKSPPQPPPPQHDFSVDDEDEEADALVKYGVGVGKEGTPRSEEIEALFHSGGSSASHRAVGGSRLGEPLDHQVDEQGWPVPSGPPPQESGLGGSFGGFYSLPNEQLSAATGGGGGSLQAVTPLTQGGWHSLSSSDEASDGSRRRAAPQQQGARPGKGSLLAILNQQPGPAVVGEAAATSPSAYSSAPALTSDEEPPVAAKDPLQILREYRAKQLGLEEPSPPMQAVQPVSPPQPPAVQQPAYPSPPQIVQPIPVAPQQPAQDAFYSPPQPAAPAPPLPPVQPPYPPAQAVVTSMPPHQALPPPLAFSQPPPLPAGYPAAAPLPPQPYQQSLPPPHQPTYPSAALASPHAQPAMHHPFPPQPPQQAYSAYSQPLPPSQPPYPSYTTAPVPPSSFPPPLPLPPQQQQQHYAPPPPPPHHPFPPHFPPTQAHQPQPQLQQQGYPSSGLPALVGQQPLPPVQASYGAPVPGSTAAPAGANRGALLGLLNARG